MNPSSSLHHFTYYLILVIKKILVLIYVQYSMTIPDSSSDSWHYEVTTKSDIDYSLNFLNNSITFKFQIFSNTNDDLHPVDFYLITKINE